MMMSETAKIGAMFVGFILAFAALIIPAVRDHRTVIAREDAGPVAWVERVESSEPDVAVQVDAKGQLSTASSISSSTQSIIGISDRRWTVEGKARFAEGDTLVIEVRQSGKRYLCHKQSTERRRCNRILRVAG